MAPAGGGILDAIESIRAYTAGMDEATFVTDRRTVDAVLYNIEIIGEAVSALPEEVKARHSDIPWRDIRNMRNVLTHVNFGVDLSRVWSVVAGDLDVLKRQLRGLLASEDTTDDSGGLS